MGSGPLLFEDLLQSQRSVDDQRQLTLLFLHLRKVHLEYVQRGAFAFCPLGAAFLEKVHEYLDQALVQELLQGLEGRHQLHIQGGEYVGGQLSRFDLHSVNQLLALVVRVFGRCSILSLLLPAFLLSAHSILELLVSVLECGYFTPHLLNLLFQLSDLLLLLCCLLLQIPVLPLYALFLNTPPATYSASRLYLSLSSLSLFLSSL